MQSAVGKNLPRSCQVRIGKRIEIKRRLRKTQAIHTLGLHAKIDLYIGKLLSISQLSKDHSEKLILASEVLDLVIAHLRDDTMPKIYQMQMHHHDL